jgi:hypothetical protein
MDTPVVSIQRKCTSKSPSSELPIVPVEGDIEYKYVLFIILVFLDNKAVLWFYYNHDNDLRHKVKKKGTALT